MHKVGATAHTSYGTGTIKEVDPGRGATSYRVAGHGFDVWIPAAKVHVSGLDTTIEPATDVNDDNYAVLPYNPTPQHHVDLFRDEQTIQPGDYPIDPDDRLHSSEDGEDRADNRPTPGPAPHLFAAYDPKGYYPPNHSPGHMYPGPRGEDMFDGEVQSDVFPNPPKDDGFPKYHHGYRYADAVDDHFGDGPESPDWGDDEWHKDLPEGPERTFGKDAALYDVEPGKERFQGESPWHDKRNERTPGLSDHDSYFTSFQSDRPGAHEASYRPAGLSARYAHFDIEAHDGLDAVSQFRRDPVGFIHTAAYSLSSEGDEDYLHDKFGNYTNLLESDSHMRTAAWNDVRQKAMRLRHEGKVKILELGPQGIYATVEGDNGTYDTMVAKTGSMGGYGGAQSVAGWHCGCEWGRWAFKRKMTFVGRLCSHAYAAYLDMQSNHAKDDPASYWSKGKKTADVVDKFKSWAEKNNEGHMDEGSIPDFMNTSDDDVSQEDVDKLYDHLLNHHQEAPERDYDTDYTLDNGEAYKTGADALRLKPKSLTPDFREVPKGEQEWVDVTKDDRKTTGPDQIMKGANFGEPMMAEEEEPDLVHFSSRWVESLHRTSAPGDWNDQLNHMGDPAPPGSPSSNVGRPYNSETGQYGDLDSSGHQEEPYTPDPTPGGGLWQSDPAQIAKLPGYVNGPEQHPAQGATTLDQAFAGGTTQQGKPTDPGAVRAQNNAEVAKSTGAPASQAGATTDTAPGGAAPGAGGWKENTTTDPIGAGSTYHVNQGDTLSDIAQRAGLGKDNYQQIADANKDKISDPNHIETGWDLKIPGQPASQAGAPGATNPLSQQPGETLNPDGSRTNVLHDGPGPSNPALAQQPGETLNPNGSRSNTKADGPATPPAPPGAGETPKLPTPPAPPPIPGAPGGKGSSSITNPGLTPPGQTAFPDAPKKTGKRRYAESSDSSLLDKLRSMSEEGTEDDLGHMDSRNDELRDLVEELQDRGYDASFAVASLHPRIAAPRSQFDDSDASDGDANFLGQSNPNWADEVFSGSGPDPKEYFGDSASYIDENERPDFTDVTDLGDDDIIKYNDSRSRPQQGPRQANSTLGDMGAADIEGTDNPTLGDFSGGSGVDMLASLHQAGEPTMQDWDDGDWLGAMSDKAQQHAGDIGGGGGDEGGEGAAVGELAEEAPVLLARRAGHGPRQAPRVDPGYRGHQSAMPRHLMAEDDGMDPYGEDAAPAFGSGATSAQGTADADILASFHRSGAAEAMMSSRSTPGDDNIAGAAQAFLRTAGRVFSPEDQHALEQESHVLGARNMPTEDDLAGTHYLML